jgi:hypothetical protein
MAQYCKLLTFIYITLSIFSSFAADEMNVCFVTINSSQEKNSFKKSLSSGENKGKFSFHELVPTGTQGEDWYDLACEKNIRCDLLVISGHFAGSFFGDENEATLTMETMEKKSCENSCDGMMSSPKEVFLLGCNTLAGKEEDNRSASEYLEVLLADNIPLSEASRTVEQRYGAIGTSFESNMKRAFKGVPHIYGFHSIGPSGSSIERYLGDYHRKVPNYYDHLMKIEVERGLALMNDFTKWNKKNQSIADALKITYFAQTSGVLVPCQVQDNVNDDPLINILNNICVLRANQLEGEESIDHVIDLLLSDEFNAYIPAITSFLESNQYEELLKEKIAENPLIKDKILGLLNNTKTSFGKVDIAKIAFSFGIITKENLNKHKKISILRSFKTPITVADKEAVCSNGDTAELNISIDDFDSTVFQSSNGLSALGCLKIKDNRIVNSILESIKSNKSIRRVGILSLGNIGIRTPEVTEYLSSIIDNNSSTESDRLIAYYSAVSIGENEQKYLDIFSKYINTSHQIKIDGLGAVSSRDLVKYSFNNIAFPDYSTFKKYKELLPKENDIEYIIAGSLIKLPVKEQIKFLEDTSETSDLLKQKYYSRVGHDDDWKQVEIDINIFEAYVKDTTSPSNTVRHNGEDWKFFEYIDLSTEDNQNKFLKIIEQEGFDNSRLINNISSLPQTRFGDSIIKKLTKLIVEDNSIADAVMSEYLLGLGNITDSEKIILRPLLDVKSASDQFKEQLDYLGVKKVLEVEVNQ